MTRRRGDRILAGKVQVQRHMKTQSLVLTVAAASAAGATYICPASLSSSDAAAIMYGYKVQGLLESYYNSVPVNASYFESLPNAKMTASNGMTLAENTVTNVEGLTKQAQLGAKALKELGMMLGLSPDECNYMLPPAPNGTAHLMNAFYLEATMCGAFIGLTDYVQAPEAAFLTARLSAEHGIHASAIGAMMQPVGFMPNSTMLTPAFTPDMILQDGMEVGKLGTWLNGCATAPSAPCGGTVTIGELLATLSSGNKSTGGMGMNGTTGMGPNGTSSTPPTYSGPVSNAATSAKASFLGGSFALAVAAYMT
ncbi:hypothetical protein LTS01_025305 [Friedmanniomyces endolithicus]|nr:hypothetical protein LTS01_025305 [Friedmanniomyces endolithicus]